MRVTIAVLGWTFDWSIEPTAAETEGNSLDGGTTASYGPIGFTASWPTVEEVPMPQRTPAWDDDE